MATKFSVPDEMWELATAQKGMLAHRQVEGFGLSRNVIQRHLEDRMFFQVARGLYSLTPEPEWPGLAWGGVLLGGDGATLGGEAAGWLHGLNRQPETIDVMVNSRMIPRGPWVFHQKAAEGHGEPRRTSIEDTALHLSESGGTDEVISILTRAVGTRRTSADRLLRRLAATPGHPHRQLIAEILGDVAQGVHSALEARYSRDVEQAHRLPTAQRQHAVTSDSRSDVVYERLKLIIELDGHLGHTGSGAFRDFRRDNRHTLLGWQTLRFGWHDVAVAPCAVAQTVARALQQLGWPGTLTSCGSC